MVWYICVGKSLKQNSVGIEPLSYISKWLSCYSEKAHEVGLLLLSLLLIHRVPNYTWFSDIDQVI